MNLVVFLCISYISAIYGALIPDSNTKILTVTEFLDKIPDLADKLDLPTSLMEYLDNKVAEYKERIEHFDEGECIINEGDNGQDLFYLLNGEVEIFKSHSDGEKVHLHIRNEQFTFGELALLGRRRLASVCALGHATVRRIPYNVAKAFLLNRSPMLRNKVISYLSGLLKIY